MPVAVFWTFIICLDRLRYLHILWLAILELGCSGMLAIVLYNINIFFFICFLFLHSYTSPSGILTRI